MFGMPKCYGARPLVALLLIAGFVLAFGQTADAQGRGRRGPRTAVRGQIVAFDGNQLILKTPSGETVIAVSERTRVGSLTRVKFADIKKGDFIASAGIRQPDGTLRAIEVRIFPEQLRGRGEGHRPFRGGPNSTMTNATVDVIVGSVAGRTVKVKYPGGEKTIVVPEDVLVMRQDVGDKSLLKPGAHVSVVARKTPNGGLTAVRIKVGKDGLVPPT